MAWTEAAMRRAGAFVALTTASALVLVLFPAPAAVDHGYVLFVPILALFAVFLLGCAAVLLSPAAPARAVSAVQWRAATARELRWAGFTGVVFCAGHVVRAVVREELAAAAKDEEEVSADKVGAVAIVFLVFLAGLWIVNLSVLTGRVGSRPVPPPLPLQAPKEELDCTCILPRLLTIVDSKVWKIQESSALYFDLKYYRQN